MRRKELNVRRTSSKKRALQACPPRHTCNDPCTCGQWLVSSHLKTDGSGCRLTTSRFPWPRPGPKASSPSEPPSSCSSCLQALQSAIKKVCHVQATIIAYRLTVGVALPPVSAELIGKDLSLFETRWRFSRIWV